MSESFFTTKKNNTQVIKGKKKLKNCKNMNNVFCLNSSIV